MGTLLGLSETETKKVVKLVPPLLSFAVTVIVDEPTETGLTVKRVPEIEAVATAACT